MKNAKKYYAISKDEDRNNNEKEKAYFESQKYYETAKKYVMDCEQLIKDNDIKNMDLINKISDYKNKLKIIAIKPIFHKD